MDLERACAAAGLAASSSPGTGETPSLVPPDAHKGMEEALKMVMGFLAKIATKEALKKTAAEAASAAADSGAAS